jgi:hypothetical protein
MRELSFCEALPDCFRQETPHGLAEDEFLLFSPSALFLGEGEGKFHQASIVERMTAFKAEPGGGTFRHLIGMHLLAAPV